MSMALYQQHRHLMKTGDCLQWSSNHLLGKTIRFFTGGKWNHTGLVIRFDQYDIDRVYTLEALTRIVMNPLSTSFDGYNGECWLFPLQDRFECYRERIGRTAMRCLGIKYDYNSFFKQAVMRVSTDAGRLYCSEYAGYAWHRSGLPVKIDPAPRPVDIPEFNIFKSPIKVFDSKMIN